VWQPRDWRRVIRQVRPATAGDISEHGIDVAGGKRVPGGSSDRRDLARGITSRASMPRFEKGAANPCRHGELLATSEAPDFLELLLIE